MVFLVCAQNNISQLATLTYRATLQSGRVLDGFHKTRKSNRDLLNFSKYFTIYYIFCGLNIRLSKNRTSVEDNIGQKRNWDFSRAAKLTAYWLVEKN